MIALPDKAIIDFWYKEPDKMLQHQIDNIIKKEQWVSLPYRPICRRRPWGW
jgi:hypothetical protein